MIKIFPPQKSCFYLNMSTFFSLHVVLFTFCYLNLIVYFHSNRHFYITWPNLSEKLTYLNAFHSSNIKDLKRITMEPVRRMMRLYEIRKNNFITYLKALRYTFLKLRSWRSWLERSLCTWKVRALTDLSR